jgi:hypothetical protein
MLHDCWKDVFEEVEVKRIDRMAAAVAVVIGLMFGAFLIFQ